MGMVPMRAGTKPGKQGLYPARVNCIDCPDYIEIVRTKKLYLTIPDLSKQSGSPDRLCDCACENWPSGTYVLTYSSAGGGWSYPSYIAPSHNPANYITTAMCVEDSGIFAGTDCYGWRIIADVSCGYLYVNLVFQTPGAPVYGVVAWGKTTDGFPEFTGEIPFDMGYSYITLLDGIPCLGDTITYEIGD